MYVTEKIKRVCESNIRSGECVRGREGQEGIRLTDRKEEQEGMSMTEKKIKWVCA